MPLEKTTEAWLKKQLESIGGMFLKWTCPGAAGVPDRILLINGHVMFVEMKQETGKLSPGQKHMLTELAKHGGMCHVVYGKEGAELFFSSIALLMARNGDPIIPYGYKIINWRKRKDQTSTADKDNDKQQTGDGKHGV